MEQTLSSDACAILIGYEGKQEMLRFAQVAIQASGQPTGPVTSEDLKTFAHEQNAVRRAAGRRPVVLRK